MRKISFIITIILDDNLKTTSFFIADLNLLRREFDNFTSKLLYCVILYQYIHKTFTVLCEKFKKVSFASSIIKNIVVFSALSKFAVKLIC